MKAWKNSTWNGAVGQNQLPVLDAQTSGLVAGTKVANRAGWVPVETIEVGEKVLTFDGGLQTVIAVTRNNLMSDPESVSSWPMDVPAGALGNREAMTILPHQPVMIESDTAEELTGDPFALIPAAALDGLRGISQTRPSEWVEVIQLHFAKDEVVYANIGALFLCRALDDFNADAASCGYGVMHLPAAQDLVDCLRYEDEARNGTRTIRVAAFA